MATQLFAQADLENAMGGASVLTQLTDKGITGQASASFVSAIIDYASGEVLSAIQVAIDLTNLTAPYPAVLVQRAAQIGAYHAFNRGTSGRGVPPDIKASYEDALRWLDDVAAGRRSLGVTPHPATGLDVEQVSVDPNNVRVTRSSMIGFS